MKSMVDPKLSSSCVRKQLLHKESDLPSLLMSATYSEGRDQHSPDAFYPTYPGRLQNQHISKWHKWSINFSSQLDLSFEFTFFRCSRHTTRMLLVMSKEVKLSSVQPVDILFWPRRKIWCDWGWGRWRVCRRVSHLCWILTSLLPERGWMGSTCSTGETSLLTFLKSVPISDLPLQVYPHLIFN